MEQKNLLEKGIEVLELLKNSKEPLTFTEILNNLKIPKTTLYRILKTLLAKEFIHFENKKYALGYGFLTFSKKLLSEIPLREITTNYLKNLCEKTKETIELIIPDNGSILYLDKVESPQSIKLVAQIGSRYKTLHASAPGKIYLAYDENIFKNFLKKEKLEKITPKTITDKEKLKKEIKKIRKNGWAYDIGEARIDVIRIAGGIFNYEKKLIGIISIAGPSYRLKNKIKDFGKLIKNICNEISKKIGYEKGGTK